VVSGACAAGYDGSFTVTASTATSVSYTLATDPGSCAGINLAVTGASYQPGFSFGSFSVPGTATLSVASTTTIPSVGSSIVVSGISPSGYDGTYTVTASTATSVSYNLATNPGTYSTGGTFAVSATGSASLGALQVSFNGAPVTLTTPAEINSTGTGTPASPTNAGYTEAGLANLQYAAGSLTGGQYDPITISLYNTSSGPASVRFGYNRADGDIADAAAAAKGKAMAIVFLDDTGAASEFGASGGGSDTTTEEIANPYYNSAEPVSDSNPPYISAIASLPANQTALVEAVAAANPNTVVVLNTENPVLMPWIANVKGVLEMWHAGEEGGTSTARLLLGQADPSGHLPITFPASATDTIWGYDETTPLYSGDTTGPHLERLNGDGGCSGNGCPTDSATQETEGIYTDYRFFDKERINPLFPFGWGLSYTTCLHSGLQVARASDGGLDVSVRVSNDGRVAGTAVPQVYLGAPSNAPSGVQFAVRQLVQFTRVSLQPRQSQEITLHVALRELQYWNTTSQQWLPATGFRSVYVGDADALHRPVGDPGAATSLPLETTIYVPHHSGAQLAAVDSKATTLTSARLAAANGAGMTCDDEQLSATLVPGNLTAPKGDWCDIIDTMIKGSLVIAGSTGVRIEDSSVAGSIIAVGNDVAADPLSSGEDVICSTTVGGSVAILDSGAGVPWNLGLCGANSVHGNLAFTGNRATGSSIQGNTVDGVLTVSHNGTVAANRNTVRGAASPR
jgi:hypothetical protein